MEVMIGIGIGTALAFFITISHDFIRSRRTLHSKKTIVPEPRTVKEKVAPFVKIHMETMGEQSNIMTTESVERLRKKIESFKTRNRFYDDELNF